MTRIGNLTRCRCAAAAWFAAGFLIAAPVAAQQVQPGDMRVQMSDVTGPNVSSLLLFETGTTKTYACPVAWGIRTSADEIAARLQAGTLESEGVNSALVAPAPAVQRLVLDILADGANARSANATVVAALSSGRNSPARAAAQELTRSMTGLLKHATAMNPARPGHRTAVGLGDAVHGFNAFVDASNAEFLADPPAEFLVIETVLSRLVISALENEGRVVDEASRRGDYGLACAPPPPVAALPSPPPAPPVKPPAERAIEVCVLEEGRLTFVPAVLLIDGRGDTLAIRDGERLPFATVHPDVGYAGDAAWVKSGEAITLGRAKYIPYGQNRVVSPSDEMTVAGEFRGVPVFATKEAGSTPKVVFVPVGAHCLVQPYHRAEEVRKGR